MILLRAVALILTAIVVITGLILAVVALLAAQWLAVATVALGAMALVWSVVKGIALIRARFSGNEKGGPPRDKRVPGDGSRLVRPSARAAGGGFQAAPMSNLEGEGFRLPTPR